MPGAGPWAATWATSIAASSAGRSRTRSSRPRSGVVVGPIRTEHGWHVARVEAVTPASSVPYREARPAIEAELLAAERSRAFAAWLESAARALVGIEPGFEHPADPVHGFPSHRH